MAFEPNPNDKRDKTHTYLSKDKQRVELWIDGNWETFHAEKYVLELERKLRLIKELSEIKKDKFST